MALKIILIIILVSIGAGAIYYFNTNKDFGGEESDTGILKGRITIGPLCPVERIPPEPGCRPTEETYKAWPIAVYRQRSKEKAVQIKPDIEGNYNLRLPVGDYIVDLEKQSIFKGNLPESIIIKKDQATILNIDIDTGIR